MKFAVILPLLFVSSCSLSDNESLHENDKTRSGEDRYEGRYAQLKQEDAVFSKNRKISMEENRRKQDEAEQANDKLEEAIQGMLQPISSQDIANVLRHPESHLHNDVMLDPKFEICRAGSEDGTKTYVMQVNGNGETYVVYNIGGKVRINRGAPDIAIRASDNPFIGDVGFAFHIGDRYFTNLTLGAIQWIEDTAYIPIIVSQSIEPRFIKTTLVKLGGCEEMPQG